MVTKNATLVSLLNAMNGQERSCSAESYRKRDVRQSLFRNDRFTTTRVMNHIQFSFISDYGRYDYNHDDHHQLSYMIGEHCRTDVMKPPTITSATDLVECSAITFNQLFYSYSIAVTQVITNLYFKITISLILLI